MFFGLFHNPQREARRLEKDARAVADLARHTYRDSVLAEIARRTRDSLAQVADLCADDATCIERQMDRYKTLHRESRRQFDQVGLTAYTFVIIHAQSLRLAEAGAPARKAIQDFLDEWPAERGSDGTLPG